MHIQFLLLTLKHKVLLQTMNAEEKHLDDLREIRSMMERSSRFISLSGLSGVFAGIFALLGAGAVWFYVHKNPMVASLMNSDLLVNFNLFESIDTTNDRTNYLVAKYNFLLFLFADAAIVLVLAVTTGIYLTTKQAKKKGQSIWDTTSQRMILNLAIPLVTGGLFCLALLYHGLIGLVAPSLLIFYGLSLINGSKYTLTDIRYLGFCEIALGLIATFFIGYGLLFWAIGFGVLHILYGSIMYFKYER